MALKKLLLSRVQILLGLCIIDLIKCNGGLRRAFGGILWLLQATSPRKETLWKFSLEMGVNGGDPSAGYRPFTCKYSPYGVVFFKKNQSILHKGIRKLTTYLKDGLKVACGT